MADRSVTVALKGDVSDLTGSIRRASDALTRLDDKVRRFNGERPSATLGVDDREAQRKVAKMRAQLDRISASKATAAVDVDAGKAGVEIGMVNAGLDRLNGRTARATVDVNTSGAQRRFSLLMSSLTALGPAVVPVGAAVGGALLGAAGGAGALAAGLGTVVLASQGVGTALKAMQKMQDATGKSAAQQATAEANLATAMGNLSVQGRQFATFLYGLKPHLDALQATAQAGLFPGLEVGLSRLEALLPQVDRLVASTSQEMGGLAADAGSALTAPFWHSFFDYIGREAAPTIDDMAHTVGNLATGFAGLLMAFEPVERQMSTGIEHLSADFASWGQGLGHSSALREFIDYVQQEGPVVVHTLESLGSAVVAIAKAGAPIGPVTLRAIGGVADAVAAIASTPLVGPTLIGVASGLGAINVALKAYDAVKAAQLLDTLSGLRRGVGNLRTSVSAFGGLTTGMLGLSTAAGKIRPALSATASFLTGPWGIAIAGGVTAIEMFWHKHEQAKQAVLDYTASLDKETGALTENTRQVAYNRLEQEGLLRQGQRLGISSRMLVDAVLGQGNAYQQVTEHVQAYVNALAGQDNLSPQVRAGYRGMKSDAQGLLNVLQGNQKELTAAQQAWRDHQAAVNDSSAATAVAARTTYSWRDAISAASQALDDQASAIEAQFNPVLGLGRAIKAQAQAEKDYAKAVSDYGANSLQAKGAQYDLLAATAGVTAAAKRLSASVLDGSTNVANMRAQLSRWVSEGLLPAKQASDILDGTIKGLIGTAAKFDESSVDLSVSAKDAPYVQAQLDKVNRLAAEMDGDSVHLKVSADVSQAVAGLQSVQAWLSTIHSKTIDITTRRNIIESGPGRVARVGGYASGGAPRAGEVAWVGEQGPELVQFTGPARVFPHAESVRMAAGMGHVRGFASGTPGADLLSRISSVFAAGMAATSAAALDQDVKAAQYLISLWQTGNQLAQQGERTARERAVTEAQNRLNAAQAALAAHQQLAANREQWAFDHASTQQQIADLDRKLAAEQAYTDEWMSLARQREQLTQQLAQQQQQAYDSSLSNLNQLLDQRERLLAQGAQAEQTYTDAVASAQQQLADATARAVDQRRQDILGFASLTEPAQVSWGATPASLISNVQSQAGQIEKWSGGLAQLRKMGLSEQAISQLGLDRSPAQLGQVLSLEKATSDQIAHLNQAVAARTAAAGQEVATEQTQMLGTLGQSLQQAQSQFHDAVAAAQQQFLKSQQDVAGQLAALGQDQGRSYVDAVSEALATGLPGVIEAARQVQLALHDAQAAQAQLSAISGQQLTPIAAPRAVATPVAGGTSHTTKVTYTGDFYLSDGVDVAQFMKQQAFAASAGGM